MRPAGIYVASFFDGTVIKAGMTGSMNTRRTWLERYIGSKCVGFVWVGPLNGDPRAAERLLLDQMRTTYEPFHGREWFCGESHANAVRACRAIACKFGVVEHRRFRPELKFGNMESMT